MNKANSIITRSTAAIAAIANPYGTTKIEPKGNPLANRQVEKRIKYSFMDMGWIPKATKKYINGKLRTAQQKAFTKTVKVNRGALGVRTRAVSEHWLKAQ